MARVFIDGFETGDAQLWDESSNPATVSLSGGSYKVVCKQTAPVKFLKNIPSGNTYFIAISVVPDEVNCDSLLTVALGEDPKLSLTRDPDAVGRLKLRSGDDNGLVLATSSITRGVPGDRTGWIVFSFDATGLITVYVNGRTSITYQHIPTTIDNFSIGSYSGVKMSTGTFDNVVVDNSEIPIRPRIVGLKPNAVGTTTEWARSTGNDNFECVNETPSDDGATFVLSNTVGQTDLYNIEDLPLLYTNIRCIQVGANAWYEGNALAQSLELIVKDNGIETVSSPISLIQYPRGYTYLLENNPNTALPYTVAEINALQIGIRAAT